MDEILANHLPSHADAFAGPERNIGAENPQINAVTAKRKKV